MDEGENRRWSPVSGGAGPVEWDGSRMARSIGRRLHSVTAGHGL